MLELEKEDYDDYVNQFASWTACRAVQRGFLKTETLKEVINTVDLQKQIFDLASRNIDSDVFDKWHSTISKEIIDQANILIDSQASKIRDSNNETLKMTYGRAAKMIAIYIKTSHIIREPQSELSKFAHPPVDKKLLEELRKVFKSEFKNSAYKPWTLFDEKSYLDTIKILRNIQEKESLKYFWMVEKYWKL